MSRKLLRVMGWPAFSVKQNPYNTLLYESLRAIGVEVIEHSPRAVLFGKYDVVHVHWPNFNWPPRKHSAYARLRLLVHAVVVPLAMLIAKARRKRIVWTIHNLRSHDTRFPNIAEKYDGLIVRLIDAHISLSKSARADAERMFPRLRSVPGFEIPHGHYRGCYGEKIDRGEARRLLGISPDARVLLSFGAIRPYKKLNRLLSLFEESRPNDHLILAGRPFDHVVRSEAREAAARNRRITALLDFIPESKVSTLFSAADLFVTFSDDSLNSGSMILALSFGIPVLVRDHGPTRDLQEVFGPDLVHLYEGAATWAAIAATLDRVTADRASFPAEALARLDWIPIAQRTRDAFLAVCGRADQGAYTFRT